MNKCSPVEMRKNLEIVDRYRKLGLDFVAIPVISESHKLVLIELGNEVLGDIVKEAEDNELQAG